MKGHDDIIELLNDVLTAELTAVNQYFLDAKMFDNWGYERLGKRFREQSIDEMKDADALIERILFLEGLPNLQDLDKLLIGENVQEILDCDLKLEMKGLGDLRAAIVHCESVRDFATRDLLSDNLDNEEDAVDFIETQLELITLTGLENYIQLQSGSAEHGSS